LQNLTVMRDVVDLPATAAWRHVESRVGFEVLFLRREQDGYRFDGHAAAVADDETWSIRYAITVDERWVTRRAHVVGDSAQGPTELQVELDDDGRWRVDGRPAPLLDGCLDVDLEASAFTNAFPVRRLALAVGQSADAPAAWVRAPGLEVERLEQRYLRLDGSRYDYAAPDLNFTAELVYDDFGLVLEYPGIATRVI
jgi:uncharacterized protein